MDVFDRLAEWARGAGGRVVIESNTKGVWAAMVYGHPDSGDSITLMASGTHSTAVGAALHCLEAVAIRQGGVRP